MKSSCQAFLFLFIVIVSNTSCQQKKTATLFTKLDASVSGIHFSNDIHDNDSSYSFINEFGYMGGGVGVGDFNNDGLPDLVFTGNQVSSRLYINKGNHQFEDITEKAGLSTNAWCTGVSIADVNADGFDDIYISVFGKDLRNRSANLLFINQHNLTFREEAKSYGLADTGYSTQAAFVDYDRDGDLDMYLVNYLLSTRNGNTIVPRDKSGLSPANDKLYRNDGDSAHVGHPVFKDVSIEAGIKEDGYGLGVSVSDFNNDGWPDIYVGNDFITNDELWLNNHDGTFTNSIAKSLQHQSYSTMGTDAADINNDGLPDIVSLDMLPEYNERRKTSFSFMKYDRYTAERAAGYEPEFMRNMLQLNNGNRNSVGVGVPFFSEVGELSGIDATDWSWSVLLADFDNDGWKDMHITNGIGRDFINGDFLEFSNSVFNSTQTREQQQEAIRKKLASLNHVNLSNYLYRNQQNLQFEDVSKEAGIDELSMSNGAAYADIDNDGDLDIIVNNIDKPAFVFINNAKKEKEISINHSLTVITKGDSLNPRGIGSKIFLYSGGIAQFQEQQPVRGYFSSVDQRILFGTRKASTIDSVRIIWPNGKSETKYNVKSDTTITLSVSNAIDANNVLIKPSKTIFADSTFLSDISYVHHESEYNDFAVQRLLPQKFSQLGPFIAVADINNDELTDFFVGGAFNSPGKLFQQQPNHSFTSKNLTDGVKFEEDLNSVFFDVDKDGDVDLLVTSGGNQYEANSIYYQPRLYINDGKGNFKRDTLAIPDSVRVMAGAVAVNDYDGDGDEDVFIGGRVASKYPEAPRSYLLQNEKGRFKDVTPGYLQNIGMVTAAVWSDFDNDKQTDLIVAGEWMPVHFFKNDKGKLVDVTTTTGLANMNGMWRSIAASDIDNDGDADFVVGNLGLNCSYRASGSTPMQLFAADLDGNKSIDPVLFYYIKTNDENRVSYPAISRGIFSEQVPAIKKQFLRYSDYANAAFNDIFKKKAKADILEMICDETRTCYLENVGNGKFVKYVLPIEAQFAPVNAIVIDDFDSDGKKDILLAGNEYQADVIRGRYDASYGCFLKGNGKTFLPVTPLKSGFIIDGDVKDLKLLSLQVDKKLLLASVNNDSLKVFSIR